MIISIDASALGCSKTGTVLYLTEILKIWNQSSSISHEFIIFSNKNAYSHLSELKLNGKFSFITAPSQRYLRVLWQQIVMPIFIKRLGVDVHWGAGFVLPMLLNKPMVVTVHDLTFQLFPTVHERIKRYYFPVMIKASVVKARTVITISESTRQDLVSLIPSSRDKSVVTLLAARSMNPYQNEILPRGLQSPKSDYVLFIGTVEPRKNLARLVDVWRSLDTSICKDVQLIVVGATGWYVKNLVSQLKTTTSIEFRGQVQDDELFELLKGAMAFIYPSLYEGFGLPVIEAMSLGIPVLTSNIGATREIAEGAAILVDPTSEEEIRAGLIKLISNSGLRQLLSRLGRERAGHFTWGRTAQQTLDVLEQSAKV